jgi:hypothetical protein
MFPKGTEINEETVANHLFPGQDVERIGFGSGYGYGVSGSRAVERVATDLRFNGPSDNDAIFESINSLGYGDCPEFLRELAKEEPDYETFIYGSKDYRVRNEMSREEQNARWDKYNKANDEWRKKVVEAIKKKNCDVYIVEYSDNEGEENSAMEHGGVFDNLVDRDMAIRFSNH